MDKAGRTSFHNYFSLCVLCSESWKQVKVCNDCPAKLSFRNANKTIWYISLTSKILLHKMAAISCLS